MPNQLKYKNKFIKKKYLDRRLTRTKNLLEAKKKSLLSSDEKKKLEEEQKLNAEKKKHVCDGRRLVDVSYLGKNLKCSSCKNILSMENITSEKLIGLHSVWNVRCLDCNCNTEVHTGKLHVTDNDRDHADVNTRLLLGILHSGSGLGGLNKLLACLNMPPMTAYIYKKYEEEVGLAFEKAAKESCFRAAENERELTIENIENLCGEL